MQQIINDFFKICKLQDDVVVNETTINGVTFNIVYMSQLVDIKKFNFEIKPSINSTNYKELSKQFLGICNPITDISEKNLDLFSLMMVITINLSLRKSLNEVFPKVFLIPKTLWQVEMP